MEEKIPVIIADDHELFVNGLQSLLSSETDIVISAIATNGRELLDILKSNQQAVVLLDINMPGMNGLEVLRYIRQSFPAVKVIMLSTYSEDHIIEKAKTGGASGYLLKTSNKDELLQTIRLIHLGKSCFPFRQEKTVPSFTEQDDFLKQFSFTRRETEIVQLIKREFTNKEIADHLHLSIYTVETHRKNIMQKLGLNTPAALIKFIIRNNL